MTAQDGTNPGAADSGGEFPDANSGLDAVDLDQADAEVAGEAPADAGVAASDSANEAPSGVGDIDQSEPDFGDADGAEGSSSGQAAESERDQVAELTDDLQRINAEYANYRKRAEERSRIVGEVAVAGVLNELLPILDDLDRAQEHGEYDGPLKAIGDSLQGVTTKLGLTRFGEVGEAFDPSVHEGLMAVEAAEGQESQSVGQVLRPGYKINDRVIRTAGVAVIN